MPVLTISALPDDIPSGFGSRSAAVAHALDSALRDGLPAQPVPTAKVESFTVSLPEDVAHRLRARAAQEGGVSVPRLAAGLLAAVARPPADGSRSAEPTDPLRAEVRALLHPLLDAGHAAIDAGRILLAEAATGSGKGRMIAALALSRCSQEPVVVAAPLAVLKQLAGEISRMAPSPDMQPRLLLGRANFVDPREVQDWLNAAGDDAPAALRAWVAAGAPPVTSGTRALAAATVGGLAWLADDAQAMADDAPVSSWLLDEGAPADCPALAVYLRLREQAMQAAGRGPILCSQILLASDVRRATLSPGSEGALPQRIGTLIVDEAHLLEQSFSVVHTQLLHVHAIGLRLRSAGVPPERQRAIRSALDSLAEAITVTCADDQVHTGLLPTFDLLPGPLRAVADSLSDLGRNGKSAEHQRHRRVLSHARGAVVNAASGRPTIQISLTPVRRYPLLSVGRGNLEKPMQALWSRCRSAVLVSATLYTPDVRGLPTVDHASWVLSIPPDRMATAAPIMPEWVKATPVLHRVPASIEPDDSAEWIDEVADLARQVVASARGGTLLLATSYRTVDALAEQLADLGDRLIVQGPSRSAAVCAGLFRERAALRSLWLGVGAAWTGIDLSDTSVSAQDDVLLTDLVIPRLPYGINRSLSHARRRKIAPVSEQREMLMMLRQGLGRLVRREGVQDRRIWIGDRRLLRDSGAYRTIRRVFDGYRSDE